MGGKQRRHGYCFRGEVVNTYPTRSEITTFNSNLETMVTGRADPGIILVDMENGAGISYSSADFEADGIHLVQTGYDKMGAAWSAAMKTFLSATPEVPGALSLMEITSSSIRLNWSDDSYNETGFEIHRSLTSGSGFTLLHKTGSNVESFIDNTVTPGETYYYQLCSVNDNGRSEFTPEESATTPEFDPDSRLIGNVNIYNSTTTSANRRAMQVTFPESGTIQSISIYHNGGSGSMLLGVYGDASGVPGSRIGVTSVVPVNSGAGWQTVDLGGPVAVGVGETVWLAWVFEDNPGLRYSKGIPARAHSSETWSGGMPSAFGSSSLANYKYSLYCTYTIGGIKASGYELTDTRLNQENPEDIFLTYPNPTNGVVKVTWENDYKDGLVFRLTNSLGGMVRILEIEPGRKEVELDLSDYNAGLFFLMIHNPLEEGIVYKAKIIKYD